MMCDTVQQPQLLVFAGSNGAGKSTITPAVPLSVPYINADDIKVSTDCSDLDAALQADRLRRQCIASGQGFTFETALSTDKNLELLESAKARGYFIESFLCSHRSSPAPCAAGGMPGTKWRARCAGGKNSLPL